MPIVRVKSVMILKAESNIAFDFFYVDVGGEELEFLRKKPAEKDVTIHCCGQKLLACAGRVRFL